MTEVLNDMSVIVRHRNNTIAVIPDSTGGTKTLLTEGKYLDSDVQVIYTPPADPVIGTKIITANGQYDASDDDYDGYSEIDVSVPNTYSASDEGKVVSNGALVAQTAHADVTPTTSDQTIDTTLNNSLKVKGDADLVAGNIKKDVEIFGVTGTYEGSGGAVSESVWMSAPDPTDGKIHVWICLTDDMSKKVYVWAGNSTSNTVDFGDGSEPVHMTSSAGSYRAEHTYASSGVYDIAISASALPANNNIAILASGHLSTRRLIRRIFLPDTFTTEVGQYKFQNAYALEKITFGKASGFDSYACGGCYSLREIILPEGTTTIATRAFDNCITATNVVVPSTVTSISTYAFNGCYSDEFHFKATAPPTLGGTNAFNNTSSSKVFYVPYSADHSILEAYKTATNWSSFASYMQEEA